MPHQLTYDCLVDIFEYLYDDENTLYSCLLVNRLCCEIAVRILWRNIWKIYNYEKPHISLSIINTLIACLPKESEEILHKNGINITIISIKKPLLFNYASFCKIISIHKINKMIKLALIKQQSIISEGLENKHIKYLLLREILKMLMNQISSLKALKYNNSGNIYLLPEAKIHLTNLTELKCDSDICSEIISQVCHNLQSLTIKFKYDLTISNGLSDLISSQNNLKILNLQYFKDYDYNKLNLSLTKHSLTLTKLTLKNCDITLPFIAMFKNLQELNLNQKFDKYNILNQLSDAYFSQLKILKINIYLEVYTVITNFLKINGKNLTELYIYNYYNKSLNLTLAKFCPNLKILYTHIKEEESLKLILNNCQYLEIIEFCYDNCYCYDHRNLLCSEIFFKVLANYSQKYFYGLILHCYYRLPLYQDLEKFFINWQDLRSQRPLSLIIIIIEYITRFTENMEDIKDIKMLVEKYMKLGIIKKFEIKEVPNYKLFSEV
ncbi:hypothetical protein RhiirA4_465222 [Rhizophagus irregularis]|uniref:F-box domain-containing protein n=1 Tax=Rhizophagus irregularis TaxID=588596 RepID=A0A2I1GRT2_9GLOM|nr:hypothetical protein RhiirA4_465222 [Rhizophagus irregularis]